MDDKTKYSVLVGNIGDIPCKEGAEAHRLFSMYVEQSKSGQGKVAGECVVLLRDGLPILVYQGTNKRDCLK